MHFANTIQGSKIKRNTGKVNTGERHLATDIDTGSVARQPRHRDTRVSQGPRRKPRPARCLRKPQGLRKGVDNR